MPSRKLSQARFSIPVKRTEVPQVILVLGPTAVGKTAFLDQFFSTKAEIVSADAMQAYRGLDIGTAKPEASLCARLPHHLIDILNYDENYNVGDFCKRADAAIKDILKRKKLPIISGGTLYYLKNWLFGLPLTPCINPKLRQEIQARWGHADLSALRQELAGIDPLSAERIGRADRYRMLRALEVFQQSGRPLSSYPRASQPRKDYRILSIGLQRNREELYARIEKRVDHMLHRGLAQEIEQLRIQGARKEHPSMRAIGYGEWFAEEDEKEPDTSSVREKIIRHSRHYAKRQITFLRSFSPLHWFNLSKNPALPSQVQTLLNQFLQGEKS